MKKTLILLTVILVGCGTVDVTKRADDTYTVSSQYGSLNGSWDRAAKEAMDKAVAFCEARREKMVIVNERRDGIYGISPQRVDLIFTCSINTTEKIITKGATTEENLKAVKTLFEKGLITNEQYNEQVKKILN